MEIIIFLVLCSLSLAVIFLGAFIWSLKSGQFDDDYTPSIRMLIDDKLTSVKNKSEKQTTKISNNQI